MRDLEMRDSEQNDQVQSPHSWCQWPAVFKTTRFICWYAPFVDDELDRKWRRSEEELPEEYLMKCRKLFVEKPNCDVHCLLSKGVVLLTNSCRSSNDGVHSTCLKLLHLANLFYNRFRKILVENQQLVRDLVIFISIF